MGYVSGGTVTNCYRYEGQIFYRQQSNGTFDTANEHAGDLVSLSDLNGADFYATALGWSSDIWDFGDLDFENGKMPTQ
ncbi:hypothetical protein FACS1894211_05070 [Clostridia bacterium]|nr:hypothetical protein FACS1894211_05070 [Clostridia bacterium]